MFHPLVFSEHSFLGLVESNDLMTITMHLVEETKSASSLSQLSGLVHGICVRELISNLTNDFLTVLGAIDEVVVLCDPIWRNLSSWIFIVTNSWLHHARLTLSNHTRLLHLHTHHSRILVNHSRLSDHTRLHHHLRLHHLRLLHHHLRLLHNHSCCGSDLSLWCFLLWLRLWFCLTIFAFDEEEVNTSTAEEQAA
jgi:hypothetical protein